MGLLLISLIIAILIIAITLRCITKNEAHVFILLFCIIPVMVGILLSEAPPAPTEYLYSADVRITGKDTETIYFNEFSQNENIVTINEYATVGYIHWLDFNFTEVTKEPLKITLLDNDDKFMYTDILLDITHNKQNMATQP